MTKIAFTSCAAADFIPDQPVWDEIAAHEPDALLRWKLANYGVLELRTDGVQVMLRGRQKKQRRDAFVARADWRVPERQRTNRRS